MEPTSLNTPADTQELLRQLTAESRAQQQAAEGCITDGVAGWITAQYTTSMHRELAGADCARRWHILRAIIRDWSVLRRHDHFFARLQLERERLKLEQEKHQHTVDLTKTKPVKHRDVFQPLTDAERLEIVRKVDEILGIRPATPIGEPEQSN